MTYGIGKIAPEKPENVEIDSDPFWPTIPTDDFYETYNVPAGLGEKTVLEYLYNAIAIVNLALAEYKSAQITSSYDTLDEVPAEEIAGESSKVRQYRRAVYCMAKSQILKETQVLSRKPDGENIARTGEETENTYREYAESAIRNLQELGLIEVELI